MTTILEATGSTLSPKARVTAMQLLLLRPGKVQLQKLTGGGFKVRSKLGTELTVRFRKQGKVQLADERFGWKEVKLQSEFGASSTMLMHDDGTVSGLLFLREGGQV